MCAHHKTKKWPQLTQPYELWPHFFMSLWTHAKHLWGVFKANDMALTIDILIYESTDTYLVPILVRLVHIAVLGIGIQRKSTKYKNKIFAVFLQQGASSTVCLVIAIQQANQDYHATIKNTLHYHCAIISFLRFQQQNTSI